MVKKREMSLWLAQKLADTYHDVPLQRAEQIKLLQMHGYRRLSGRPFDQCPDNQVYSVATRVLHDAYIKIHGKTPLQIMLESDCRDNYQRTLYHTFNIPVDDEHPTFLPISELERQLLD